MNCFVNLHTLSCLASVKAAFVASWVKRSFWR